MSSDSEDKNAKKQLAWYKRMWGFFIKLRGVVILAVTTGATIFIFFIGPGDVGKLAIDKDNGWVYVRSTFFGNPPTLALRPKDMPVYKEGTFATQQLGGLNMRARPAGAVSPMVMDWIGLGPRKVGSALSQGDCVRINAIRTTGWQSVWAHVTRLKGANANKCRE